MDDKELILLAAKAAGLVIAWRRELYGHRDNPDVREGWCIVRADPLGSGLYGAWWNPLRDDGDALRLAVKLQMQVTSYPVCSDASVYGKNNVREIGDDPYAATRRAIVRAAAEIGGTIQS